PALARLQQAGFRLAALTNSAAEAAQAQLGNAGLAAYFEHILSVDEVRCYKPAPQPYRMAASRLGVDTGQIRMVAVHDWDVIGAMSAGCTGAFVARNGSAFNPLAGKPDVIGRSLEAVANRILEVDQ